jgi:hypothetical protein
LNIRIYKHFVLNILNLTFKIVSMKSGKCCWIHVSLAIIGVLFFIGGVISYLFVKQFLGVDHPIHFFIVGNSFVLLAIVSKLLCKCNCCCCKDEKCETETK